MWNSTVSSAWPLVALLLQARPTVAGRHRFQPALQSFFTTSSSSLSGPNYSGRRRRPTCTCHYPPSVSIDFPFETISRHLISRRSSSSIKSTSEPLQTLEGNDIYAAEEVIKKSRFIGYASHCTSWDEAQTILQNVRSDHPKSRHVCFGFVSSAGAGGEEGMGTERCSDDGEPTGTAGVPILGAIKGEQLSDTLCVIVRYFGGVKLGAGGLIRAYGGAARLVLRSAMPYEVHVPKSTMRLSTRTANSGTIYAAAAKYGGVTSGETYNDRGELEVSITCDEENAEQLKVDIVDGTRGGVMIL